MEVRQRYYYKKNADGTRTKVYYYPRTHVKAVAGLQEAIAALPDAQGVSAQVATNTAAITALDSDKADQSQVDDLALSANAVSYDILKLGQHNAVDNVLNKDNLHISITERILPAETITGKYIDPLGMFYDVPSDFKIDKYDVSSLQGDSVVVSGQFGYTIESICYGFNTEDGSVDRNFKYLYSDGTNIDTLVEKLLTIPNGAKFLFIEYQDQNGGSLDLPCVYKYKKISSDIVDKRKVSAISILDRHFITSTGTVSSINSDEFHVDIYDVSSLRGKCVILNGTSGGSVTTTIYTFSNNSTTNSSKTYVTGGYGITFNNRVIRVPNFASYLFVERADTFDDDLLVYAPVYNNENNIYYTKLYDADVLICPIYGQSLAIGGEAYPVITKSIKYPNHQVGIDMQVMKTPYANNDNVEKAVYGLQEGLIKFALEQNGISINELGTQICSFVSGSGSTSITKLKKGNTLYDGLITSITNANTNAINIGKKAKVPAIVFIQGEEDMGNNYSLWKDDLIQLQQDLESDVKAITGQDENIPFVLYQTNQLGVCTQINSTNYNSGAKTTIINAQHTLIRDTSKFLASTPIYWMDFYDSAIGYQIHINGYYQKIAGYYYGKAIFDHINGSYTKGLIATNYVVNGNNVEITFSTKCLGLYLDSGMVNMIDNYGFNVVNASNQDIIDNVSVSCNKVIIKCKSNPSGCKLRYAVNGETNKAGRVGGARGCLRDSQGMAYNADIKNMVVPMHNWAYAFETTL